MKQVWLSLLVVAALTIGASAQRHWGGYGGTSVPYCAICGLPSRPYPIGPFLPELDPFLYRNRVYTHRPLHFRVLPWLGGFTYGVGTVSDDIEYENELRLQSEVRRLQRELDDMENDVERVRRRERDAESPQPVAEKPVPPPAVVEDHRPATQFVMRDGRVIEQRNYVITDDTVWMIADDRTTKVPLDQIDIAQTEQRNSARGLILKLPHPAPAHTNDVPHQAPTAGIT